MIRFLFKGLLRDRQRSLLPVIVVTAGVMLTVFAQGYIHGIVGDMVDFTARFTSGHVKVMTRAYNDNMNQVPLDLALTDVSRLMQELEAAYPEITWVQRIMFGGLLDVPDENGETRVQGVTTGIAADLLSPGSTEPERMTLDRILVRGHLPEQSQEILISEDFARKLEVDPGDQVTLMGSTMYGSMSFYNFYIAGTIRFGIGHLDRSAIIVDLQDARLALNMEDACGEILGYLPGGSYDMEQAGILKTGFNQTYTDPEDEFSPVMIELKDEGMLGGYMEMIDSFIGMIVFIFVLAMAIVLWNTGLIGGLRRYGEVGVRLAIGEEKGHIYRSMIYESLLIGLIGASFGTIIGLLLTYWVQEKGIDISGMMANSTMMMPGVLHARVTPTSFYIGFIPGLFATVIGTSLAGIGIYKRKTAQLFKELET